MLSDERKCSTYDGNGDKILFLKRDDKGLFEAVQFAPPAGLTAL